MKYVFAKNVTLKETHALSFSVISFYLITIIAVIKCDSLRRIALALRAGLSEG